MLERGAKAAQWERVCLCVCACACESEHKCACVCALLLPREQWTLLQRDWERGRGTGKQLEIQVTMINILQQLVASINAGATKPIPKPIPKRSKTEAKTDRKPNRTERSEAASASSVFAVDCLIQTRKPEAITPILTNPWIVNAIGGTFLEFFRLYHKLGCILYMQLVSYRYQLYLMKIS